MARDRDAEWRRGQRGRQAYDELNSSPSLYEGPNRFLRHQVMDPEHDPDGEAKEILRGLRDAQAMALTRFKVKLLRLTAVWDRRGGEFEKASRELGDAMSVLPDFDYTEDE